MMARRMSVIFIICLFSAMPAFCQDIDKAESLFSQGNQSYAKEGLEEAITAYETILNMGLEGGALYYNLGNAYFKHGSLGKAILNYLRAKRFLPRDADLASNLSYARSLIKGGQVSAQKRWFYRILSNLSDSLTFDESAILSLITYSVLCLSLIHI